jgi:Tol biopolymer transport system component
MKKILLFALGFSFLDSPGQTGSEIYHFDLKVKGGQVVLSNGKNITNHKGYDNQPFFHPSQPVIYYSSFDDSGRSDIKYYNYERKETMNLTLTHEREYSPTVTPDGQSISCIIQRDNGAQDLGKYPINGGKPEVLINHLKIGYHAWAGENKLLLFILDDSSHNSLHYYDLSKNAGYCHC